MSHKIGGEGFDNLKEIDIKEMFEDEALEEDDIIQIISDPAQLGIPENYNEYDEGHVTVTAKSIREGLQICSQLENHFLEVDTDCERALKFQRELQLCISSYRELYKELAKSTQTLITDYVYKE